MKTTSLIIFVFSLLVCLVVPLNGQSGTFTVYLPDLYSQNIDSITVPNGRPIYALLVSGYGRNGNFDELHFYNFAREIMAHGGYVHYAWWNNLLAPYMERPLHNDQSYPGKLGDDLKDFADPTQDKALPGEDYQFVYDARKFLSAIQEHNPEAIIIVVGHSMGGGAIIHLANAWTTDDNGRIDILAPIDPVGNRNWPWAGGFARINKFDFNWTRWRATRDFFGYKKFKNFGTIFNPDCQPDGDWIADYNTAKNLNDPLCGNEPYIHPPVNTYTFNEYVVHLYHRWQTEFLFPFDFEQSYYFGHNPPAGGSTYQEPVITTPKWCGNLQRCEDPYGWPEDFEPSEAGCCAPTGNGVGWDSDGHGEIVGYRGPITLDGMGPVPLAVRVGTSPNCGTNCTNKNWPWRYKVGNVWNNSFSSNRVEKLLELESLPVLYWEHSPQRPNLSLVDDGLTTLFDQIVTDVISDTEIPENYFLEQNYPNPFNPNTTIKYSVPEQSKVIIKVYDLLGREAATLVNEDKFTGNYAVEFDASKLSSGTYFYRIQTGSFVETKKMILLK